MDSKQTILVVGLGRFGVSVCEKLAELGQHVIAVDIDKQRVEEVADVVEYCAQLDATDEDLLVKVGAREADIAVVAIGNNIEASILATAILKGLNIPKVIARAQTSIHGRVLSRVGAHKVVFPERDAGKNIAETMVNPWLSAFSAVPGGGVLVGEIEASAGMVGKSLMELEFRKTYNCIVLLFDRKGSRFLPRPDSVIQEGDKLLVAGTGEDIAQMMEKKDKEENGK